RARDRIAASKVVEEPAVEAGLREASLDPRDVHGAGLYPPPSTARPPHAPHRTPAAARPPHVDPARPAGVVSRSSGMPACPFCDEDLTLDTARRPDQLDPELLLVVLANNPWWRPEMGLCAECAERFTNALHEARTRHPALARGGAPILPTPV